jgi:DNA-binding transcriptional regulator YhcF (GntR family)
MDVQLDAGGPIPIYHQIAEAIRYRIATGVLRPGQRLPAVRAAGRRWKVHFHTVRRAYQELARQGIVIITRGKGVSVGAHGPGPQGATEKFINRITREAARRFGLSPADLARRVLSAASAAAAPCGPVAVLECSLTQCQDLAQQIRRQFAVDVVPWPLSNPDPLPPGEIVATLFHCNELRQRCPERFAALHFASIRLDAGLASALSAADSRTTLLVCDPDPQMTRNIAADVAALFAASPGRPRIVLGGDSAELRPARGRFYVLSPRRWGMLPESQHRRPDIIQARYVFDGRALLDLAARLGWPPTHAPENVA